MRTIAVCVAILVSCRPTLTAPSRAAEVQDVDTDVVGSPKPPPACPSGTPTVLAPAADAEAFAALDATGIAVYACRGGAWQAVDADALLSVVGRTTLDLHHFGPSLLWNDASSAVVAQAASAVVDTRWAPWVLWNVTAHGAAAGVLSPVTQVQRLSTVGGGAPTTACGSGNAGQTAEVAFTARYFLYQRSAVAPPHQRCGGG